MRAAILLSGTSYNFKYSIKSLMQNLVIPNDADVFILTSRDNMKRRIASDGVPVSVDNWDHWVERSEKMQRHQSVVSPDDVEHIKSTFGDRLKSLVFIDDVPEYQEYLEGERIKLKELINDYRANNHPAPFGGDVTSTDNGNVKCMVDQYNHVKKCFEYMVQSGIKYDYVLRARMDFVCPFEFKISEYLNGDNKVYVCGSFRDDPMEWADEFCFFTHRSIADKLFTSLDRMGFITDKKYNTVYNNNEFVFAPETQFSILLHELNLPVTNVKIYRSACYTDGCDGYDYMNYRFLRLPDYKSQITKS